MNADEEAEAARTRLRSRLVMGGAIDDAIAANPTYQRRDGSFTYWPEQPDLDPASLVGQPFAISHGGRGFSGIIDTAERRSDGFIVCTTGDAHPLTDGDKGTSALT